MPPTTHPDRAASASPPWYTRRRSIVALLLVVLLLGLRAALPAILRSQIEKRANAAIAGQLSVGDVDLWLLSGAMALKDVVLRAETTVPDASPVLELQRLYAQLSYWSLFRRTVHVKDLVLERPAVHLERLASGAVALPSMRAVPEPSPGAMPATTPSRTEVPGAEPAAAKPAGSPWNLVIDQLRIHAGRISLRDHVSEPPKSAELSLGTLSFRDFTLLRSEERAPGHGSIEAKFGDGTVRIDTTVTTRAEGYAFEATLDLADVPLDRLQQHVPQLGWSTLTGRLDAHVTLRAQPHELPSSSGTVALRDLRIDVPGESEPALGWRKLALDIEEFGIIRRRAIVKTVLLEGGVVVVTPKGVAPLPVLRGAARADGKAVSTTSPAPPPAATPAAPSEPLQPWVWRVGTIDVVDTRTSIVLAPSPLVVEIPKGTISGLESTPGARAAIDLQLREGQGSLGLTGKVGIDPPAAQLGAKLAALALDRLLAASGVPLPVELPSGTLGGDLAVQADRGPLIVSGKLALANLGVRLPRGADFAVECKRLEVGIKQVRVPGVLPGAAPRIPEPVRVDLDSLELLAPVVTLTRTADGLVLPSGNPPRSPTATPPAPVAKAKSRKTSKVVAPAAASASPIAISLAVLDLQGGQLNIVDQTVKPLYRGKVSALALKARGIRVPENVFRDVALSATLPGGAPLRVDAKQTNGVITLTANGKDIPLQQFNPYVTPASGYSIWEGRLTVSSNVRWAPDKYESTTDVEFDQLGMAGAEGDSLFLQKVGIPLSLALSLLRDLNGKISLTVPVSGDKSGTQVAIGEIVAQALVKAILGAVTSPLKMLGVVAGVATGGGGPVLPEPIQCVPGLPVVEASAEARVQQLGDALGGAPALRITLRGMAGGPDVRALQEAAVLDDLNAKQGVIGGLKNLANRKERNAIRDFLTARGEGGSAPELSADYGKTLDEWAQAKTVSDDQLRALATARAEAAKTALVTRQGIDATRVAVGDPEIDRENGKPAVHVAFNPP